MTHQSVLLKETLDGLEVRQGDTFVDCTLGNAGHSLEALKRTEGRISLIGFDLDADAIARARERLEPYAAAVTLVNESFRHLGRELDRLGVGQVDRIIMDLGVSSEQIDESGRGFTFKKDEPLEMTLAKRPAESGITARTIVNTWDEENIAAILQAYGDERFARRIAKRIADCRALAPIETTAELAEIVKSATPAWYRHGRIHPATRTFQALRITVNDELVSLQEGIAEGFKRLRPGGRMAAISFHSGEDRIVKNMFRDLAKSGEGALVTKKPITPGDEEVGRNPRSRSAKLRVIEKKQ